MILMVIAAHLQVIKAHNCVIISKVNVVQQAMVFQMQSFVLTALDLLVTNVFCQLAIFVASVCLQ